jgi:hypothetical protein
VGRCIRGGVVVVAMADEGDENFFFERVGGWLFVSKAREKSIIISYWRILKS